MDQSFERFLQEYEIAHRLRHASIVRCHELGVADDHAYLSMDYFPDGDLRRRIRAGILPAEALELSAQIAGALGALHEAGALHRDLKPGNVLMRGTRQIALSDFGLAKDVAWDLEITDPGLIFGTPQYMSPEQGHGEPVDGRSDLYSLGVILLRDAVGREAVFGDQSDGSDLQASQPADSAPAGVGRAPGRRWSTACWPSGRRNATAMRWRQSACCARPRQPRARPEMARCRISCRPRHRAAWAEAAARRWQLLLVDHANCEKKAASTALALMFAYPEDRALSLAMARLAREELRHFEQVQKLMHAACRADGATRRRRAMPAALRAQLATIRTATQTRPAAGRRTDRGALLRAL